MFGWILNVPLILNKDLNGLFYSDLELEIRNDLINSIKSIIPRTSNTWP